MAAVQGADDGAAGDVERGEQVGRAVPDIVVAAPLGVPGIIGSTGWDRSSAWMPDFSSTHSARSGGLWYRPTTSTTLSTNSGSEDSLNVPVKCGLMSNLRQIRPIVDLLSPLRPAIEARDQCVAFSGVSSKVAAMTSSTLSSRIDGGRPGRASSCRPSGRLAMNRARHRATVDSSSPRSAATCLLVPPSAHASTIFARSARYWAVFARLAHRSNWARSASSSTRPGFGRPIGATSSSPASRWSANWRRHFDTDLTVTPSACAAPALDIPSAHARMIRARSASRRPADPARRTSSARSSSDSTISAAEGPGCDTTTC